MLKHIFCFLVIGLILLSISACGSDEKHSNTSDNDSADSSRVIEPCELISREEAEELVGEKFKAAEKNEQKKVGLQLCLYNSTEEHAAKFLQISITQSAFMDKTILESGQSPKSIFESIKSNFEDELTTENIGDEAFLATPGLHILKSGYYLVIGVGNTSDENNREILRKAGKLAVENLEKIIK